jgi:hypothetical protein
MRIIRVRYVYIVIYLSWLSGLSIIVNWVYVCPLDNIEKDKIMGQFWTGGTIRGRCAHNEYLHPQAIDARGHPAQG